MKPFTKSAAGKKRLLRVCDVLRNGMGMSSIPYLYQFPGNIKDTFAHAIVYRTGWKCHIRFGDKFFQERDLERQLQIATHEHVHATMMPLYQCHNLYFPRNKKADDAMTTADEIICDHLVMPWLNALRPQINRALGLRAPS